MNKLLKFGLVGVVNTTISVLCYILLVKLGISYILSNIISYILGILNSYYWNKKWVFNYQNSKTPVFIKFVAVNLVVLGISTFSLFQFVQVLGLNQYIAQIFSTGIGMIVNFISNKNWTFAANSQSKK